MQVESSIQKESWYREIESLRLFKPSPPSSFKIPFSDWIKEQYSKYRKYLRLPPGLHLPPEELGPIIFKLKKWYHENRMKEDPEYAQLYQEAEPQAPITKKDRDERELAYRREWNRKKLLNMTPEEKERFLARHNELRKKHMQEDPGYVERQRDQKRRSRERLRQEMQSDPERAKSIQEKEKERKKKVWEQHKKRMQEDPEYAEAIRERDREKQRRYWEETRARKQEDPAFAEDLRNRRRLRKRQYDEHKRRLRDDPEYAQAYSEKMKSLKGS